MSARRSVSRGFAMMDLLVTMVVTVIVTTAGWSLYRGHARALSEETTFLAANEAVRSALGFIVADLRDAGVDPTSAALAGAPGIAEGGPDYLSIRRDMDGSGAIETATSDPSAEVIVYTYDSSSQQIRRTVAATTSPVIGNVPSNGLSFTYYNASGALLSPSGSPSRLSATDRAAVRLVHVTVRATAVNGSTVALGQDVGLRNSVVGKL